jgi:hypothetical protein
MSALPEIAGEARQSWFGEAADHGGQQICELNRAHQVVDLCRSHGFWLCSSRSSSTADPASPSLSRISRATDRPLRVITTTSSASTASSRPEPRLGLRQIDAAHDQMTI